MCILLRNVIIKNNDKISKLLLRQVRLVGGNILNENEMNDIKKINNDKELIKNILIHEEFQEFEDDEEDDDFEKIMEKRNQKLIISQQDNEKIKESQLLFDNNEKDKDIIFNFDKNYFFKIEKNVENILY